MFPKFYSCKVTSGRLILKAKWHVRVEGVWGQSATNHITLMKKWQLGHEQPDLELNWLQISTGFIVGPRVIFGLAPAW